MKALLKKGVKILHPDSTWIDESVIPDRISSSAVIHPGCRISGSQTSIGPECVIGKEAPATIENCQLGASVALKGGSFSNSVFLDDVSVGSSAHIRPYCLMEEQSSCGHAVGLKQTLLLPFATLGSMINFCDCLMTGGTDRSNHSEVGSSYVHFNYSPRRHKATPSLFGDIPRGVMLDQPPIFLGGQGGAVGPVLVTFGTVTAAGTVLRRDVTEEGKVVFGSAAPRLHQYDFSADAFGDISHLVEKNILYVANLHALREWYRHVRVLFANAAHQASCQEGAINCLSAMIDERLNRLSQMAGRVNESSDSSHATRDANLSLAARCAEKAPHLASAHILEGDTRTRDNLLGNFDGSTEYIRFVKSLDSAVKSAGTKWLSSIVQMATDIWNS